MRGKLENNNNNCKLVFTKFLIKGTKCIKTNIFEDLNKV